MPGHARNRGGNSWELRVYLGRDPLTGRKRYETKTVHASGPREADRLLAAWYTDLLGAGSVTAEGTFGDLIEQWYRHRSPNMTPAGQKTTRQFINANLRPSPLWTLKLDKLAGRGGTRTLDEFYTALRERGGRCRRRTPCTTSPCPHGGGGPLSAATVHRVHVIVRAALEQAVTWDLIARNPASNASPGDIEVHDIRPPEAGGLMRLFQVAAERDREMGRLLILAAVTGARRGELLALWWDDIDLDAGVANFRYVISTGAKGMERIRKGRGKSNRKGGDRLVPLHPAVTALLRAQYLEDLERAEKALIAYPEGVASYVFPALERDGPSPAQDDLGFDPWRPDSTSRRFRHLREAAGLGDTRLHDLRHFVVTELLSAGIDLRTVQEVVGHAPGSPTTMRVYGHVRDPNKIEAAGVMARLLELTAGGDEPS